MNPTRKVLLILCDGMRPDSLAACGNPYVDRFRAQSAATLSARTVMPSVTLPCHMSLFLSVDPERHGILTNTYVPQVRPIDGLVDHLYRYGKRCAMFYTWEPLRDLTRPGSLCRSVFADQRDPGPMEATEAILAPALSALTEEGPDFVFLYLGAPDELGHDEGWMSPGYLRAVSHAWDCIRQVMERLPSCYTVFVTADHGGHGRSHGEDGPEDMTIPLMIRGEGFAPGSDLPGDVSIKDLTPTIAALLGVPANRDWEGRCLV